MCPSFINGMSFIFIQLICNALICNIVLLFSTAIDENQRRTNKFVPSRIERVKQQKFCLKPYTSFSNIYQKLLHGRKAADHAK